MKTKEHCESGRSLGETLSVLAIMGILSTIGLAMYSVAMDKKKANDIVYDARAIHTLTLFRNDSTADWTDLADFSATTKKHFSYFVDKTKHHYIKVDGIEKSVCKQMLALTGNDLHFYSEEKELMSDCTSNNAFVIDFDNNGPIADCAVNSDCTVGNAHCISGKCISCSVGSLDGTGEESVKASDGTSQCRCEEGEKFSSGACYEDKCATVTLTSCQSSCDFISGDITAKDNDSICDYADGDSDTQDGVCLSGSCIKNTKFTYMRLHVTAINSGSYFQLSDLRLINSGGNALSYPTATSATHHLCFQ